MMLSPTCRNWQTRQTQNLLQATVCGFKSHCRHQSFLERPWLEVIFRLRSFLCLSYADGTGFFPRLPKKWVEKNPCYISCNTGIDPHFRSKKYLACPEGFEPPTYWFVASHSIQLSYQRIPIKIYQLIQLLTKYPQVDLVFRSQTLYPTELPAHMQKHYCAFAQII